MDMPEPSSRWAKIAARARSIKVRRIVHSLRPRFNPERLRVISVAR